MIVTHNMQQAARVSATARRSSASTAPASPASWWRWTPPRRSSPTPAGRRPSTTSRAGSADVGHGRRRRVERPDRPAGRVPRASSTRSARRSPSCRPASPSSSRGPPRSCSDQDLEGAEYMILADDEVDATCVSAGGALLLGARPAVAGGHRPAPGRRRAADHRRDRAVRRPRRQHLQGGPADLRPPARPAPAGHHPEDGRPGPAAVPRSDRVVPDQRRHPGRRARRHGLLPRRPAAPVRRRPSSRATPARRSTSRSPSSWPSWPASTSASATTPSTSASASATWSPAGCPSTTGAARFATRAAASDLD